MDKFKKATQDKLRFQSTTGLLTVEQLWDLPLNSATKANLNDVARTVFNTIETTQDFVSGTTKDNSVAELKLEIVKEIIADRLAENKAKLERAETLKEIEFLEGIKEAKEIDEIKKLSRKKLNERLKELKSKTEN